jgi:hypothetical protein
MRAPADQAAVRRSPWRRTWLHGPFIGLCSLAAVGTAVGVAADEASVVDQPDEAQVSNETIGTSTEEQALEANQLEAGKPDGMDSVSVARCTNVVVARNVGGNSSVQHSSAKQTVRITQNGSQTQVECH